MKTKYIKTSDNIIIVFSELLDHSDFRSSNPVSAGFISIGAIGEYEPSCQCYGVSITLGMESDPDIDTKLAKKQILGYY